MPKMTPAQAERIVRAFRDTGENVTHAAKSLGISRSNFQFQLTRAQLVMATDPPECELPQFPDGSIPTSKIIDHLTENFVRQKAAVDARTWFPIKIKVNEPIGVLFVGDVHIDDNGCDWPTLRKHAELSKKTPGLYAVNIGDSTNSWGGRLIKKYADQDTSVHTARRLVEWLLIESGFRWIVWLMGNHEPMGDAAPLIREMNKRHGTYKVPMLDWEARFVVQFPNGEQFKINAAHDFPGSSHINPLHGPVRAAREGLDCDIYACGHRHNWGVSQWEYAEKGTIPTMIRARGYKFLDDFARRIGKYDQQNGQSILVVLDPNAKSQAGRVIPFVDVEAGAAYLKFLRGRK